MIGFTRQCCSLKPRLLQSRAQRAPRKGAVLVSVHRMSAKGTALPGLIPAAG
jgi:hypothetical protein